jgi:hypothetical protein
MRWYVVALALVAIPALIVMVRVIYSISAERAKEYERPPVLRGKTTLIVPTPEEARDRVAEMGLPRVFLDVWEERIPRQFIDWQRPETFFRVQQDLVRRFPRIATCVPLWESNRDQVYAYDAATGEYIVFYYFDDDLGCDVLADSYQRFAAAYLVDCVYAGEERLDEIASLLEFNYVDRVRKFAVEDPDPRLSSREEKQQLIESIPRE